MTVGIYYDEAASLADLEGVRVAVIGYGIQGRAFAANLRDSGIDVCVGNIDDEYYARAVADGQTTMDISAAVARADVILMLIPDEAHRDVFRLHVRPHYRQGACLVVAHGFSLTQGHVEALPGLDLAMLAPRMYGDPIRQYYLAGQGAPAYLDIIADQSGRTLARVLAVARAVGFTRAGVMPLDYRQETELDLFQEQFLAPALVDLIDIAFGVLVEQGFDPRAALLELYGSGEMGKMLLDGAARGLDEVVEQQGSPTCQVGYHLHRGHALPEATLVRQAQDILRDIKGGAFATLLKKQAERNYPLLDEARASCSERPMSLMHREVRRLFHFPADEQADLYRAMQPPLSP
jgi:ketol-acid reductoisomerase